MKREGNRRKKYVVSVVGALLLLLIITFGCTIYAEAAVSGTVTASTLFMRKGPSTEYPKVTVDGTAVFLSRGDSVAISHGSNGWYYVTASFEGTRVTGYVSAAYIATNSPVPTGAPSPTPRPTSTPKPTAVPTQAASSEVLLSGFPRTGTVTASNLRVRDEAGTGGSVITTVANGTKLTLKSAKKDSSGDYWYQIAIEVNGVMRTGYVSSDYISVAAPTSTPKPTATPVPGEPDTLANVIAGTFPRIGKVTASKLNVRPDASTSRDAVASLVKDTKVSVLAAERNSAGEYWYQISFTEDGIKRTGYVRNDFIAVDKIQATPTPTPVPTGGATIIGETISRSDVTEKADYYYSAIVTATKLNLRAEANTTSEIVAQVVKNTQVLIIGQTEGWYRVAVKYEGRVVYGYMSRTYLKLALDETVVGKITTDRYRLRAQASNTAAYVKTNTNAVISLSLGEVVTVMKEVEGNDAKWFQVAVVKSGIVYSGYVQEDNMILSSMPAGTPTPTVTPKPTATPTPIPTGIPISITPTPTPSVLPEAKVHYASNGNYPVGKEGTLTGYGEIREGFTTLVAYTAPDDKYQMVYDRNGYLIGINEEAIIYLYDMYVSPAGKIFRHIGFHHNDGRIYYGYVLESRVGEMSMNDDDIAGGTLLGSMADFERYMELQGFPDSYKPMLRKLHEEYPKWIFKAHHTGLVWEDVIDEEDVAGKNLISNSKSEVWKSQATGAYDWSTGKYIVYDGSTWVTASREAIEYYMDPRNFLNESTIYMFEVLRYAPEYQTEIGVENVLLGTPLEKNRYVYLDENGTYKVMSYADTFIQAADYSGVSPYHLASRVKQEILKTDGTLSNSVTGTVKGYENLYNFFNIGAYHSTAANGAIINGLKYAANGATNNDKLNDASLIPWSNPYKAIVGGAYIIGDTYINRGQDTIYLQKFNVTENSTYYHQYMANVEAPYSESKKVASAYGDMADYPIVFSIPVYLEMPKEAVESPAEIGSSNNWLKSLKVYNNRGKEVDLAPEFNLKADHIYYAIMSNNDSMVEVRAEAVSEEATVFGTGVYALATGSTKIVIEVEAANGEIREYNIFVVRPD